jgi:GlpG protein
MRQIGSLSKRVEAERLAAYLVTEGIPAHSEEDGEAWAIWVRDENQLDVARDAFRDFRGNPDDPRYQGVERSAAAIREEEIRQREAARKNVVEMRGKWSRGGAGMTTPKRAPLVFVLIGACIIISMWTRSINGDRALEGSKEASLLAFASDEAIETTGSLKAASFVDIQKGQVWRLITPIFPHIGPWHLVMNLYWLYRFGAQIEHFRGTKLLAILVLAAAAIPNVAQAAFVGPNFFGISGVVCGLFGYVWISSQYDPSSQFDISRFTIAFFLVYLFYCLVSGWNIANAAHFVGLGVGAVFAYVPIALKHGG